jgi:tRNA uridine 5-carboxymethylaminomethyl modification enzyme
LSVLQSVREQGKRLDELLLRPDETWSTLAARHEPLRGLALDPDVALSLETDVKYAGYVDRQEENVVRMLRQESVEIPDDLDYRAMTGLANEAKDKLSRLRPRTLGQAARIAGVRPPDVALLAVHVERRRRE